MTEERLTGGRVSGAVRIGDVVHKPAAPWTPTVHAFLRHLADVGFEGAPAALGVDDEGREMISYLAGEAIGERVPWPSWVRKDSMVVQVGEWLRRLHEASASFRPPDGERWFAGGALGPGLVIGHQDAAPWNAVMSGDRLVGFFDWDGAGPSSRELDLAFSALTWVPLFAPEAARRFGFTDPGDRSRRLHLLLDAYGYDGDRRAFGGVVAHRARLQAGVIRGMAGAGDPVGAGLLPVAENLERSADEVESLSDGFWTEHSSKTTGQ